MRTFTIICLLHMICVAQFAWAKTIRNVSVHKDRIVITFDGDAPKPTKLFRIENERPRIVIDWLQASYALDNPQNQMLGQGAVKSVRYAERGKGTRLVLDMSTAKIPVRSVTEGQKYTLLLGSAASVDTLEPTANAIQPAQPKQKITAAIPRYFKASRTPYPIVKPVNLLSPETNTRPNRRPVIVIDPGHGGYDPGALGKKGTKEKKITFAASKELQRQLLATGRYDVILTRSKDVYVDHEERLRIARAGGADLFISVHADSAGKSARGATVYTLADRAKTRSRRLVNTQNWIMDVDLTEQTDPVGDILVDLAQRSTKTASTEFADILLSKLKTSTRLINNSHRRAGYFVLLAPDVPAVLLELGYLSHSGDEALLNTEKHRKKLMRSVTQAINVYFAEQRP